jgi:signal transduction histidine kinase/ActR/RegA family two-component response regulator
MDLAWTVERMHPEDREALKDRIDDLFAKTAESEMLSTAEFRWKHKSGEWRWFSDNRSRIFDDEGGLKAIVGTIRDITERKNLEEQLQQAMKMEAIGRLAGGVAHDFNNLLSVILTYSRIMLENKEINDSMRADLKEIGTAGERASSLTRQLLAFSRKQVLQPELLDLKDVITNMHKMLGRLIGEDIELTTILKESMGQVKADPGQIEQVIMNLAVNARDAMPRGGKLTVEIADAALDEEYAGRHAEVDPGPYVMLAVSDTGHGMDAETKSKIFDPFFTTKEKGKGTGLGLATVYGIVKQSGGNVVAYSEPGKGTTFKIYLPRVEEGAYETGKKKILEGESLRGSETVLVVEDDESVRSLVCRLLQEAGYTVLKAADGAEALKINEQHPETIHLMVTDVVMPGMGGRKLAERLGPLRPEMKILYMSGYTDNAIVHHGALDPGTAFLQKPITKENLLLKTREALEKEQPEA